VRHRGGHGDAEALHVAISLPPGFPILARRWRKEHRARCQNTQSQVPALAVTGPSELHSYKEVTAKLVKGFPADQV
jgi:hypothetical protein